MATVTATATTTAAQADRNKNINSNSNSNRNSNNATANANNCCVGVVVVVPCLNRCQLVLSRWLLNLRRICKVRSKSPHPPSRYEGGIRVPGIVRYPGVVPPGTTTDVLVSTMDVFPTVLTWAGINASHLPKPLDGKDASGVFMDPKHAVSPHDEHFLWHYCGTNVAAARHKGYKFHFATAIWGTDTEPSPKCVQCCPNGPTSLNGTGGSLCDCGKQDLKLHDPPLVFDMHSDRNETTPLTPATLPQFDALVAAVKAALEEHKKTIHNVHDEMHTLPDPLLRPCCDNGTYPFADCQCNEYVPGKYPYP
eukprot:m.86960 g.86960  ORF g.86960 m.86960 type:complete len:308 (-) comp14892_c0_seq4:56-979(-)